MNAPSSVSALTSALVHQSALSSPASSQRHAAFIAKRFAITFSVLAVAPFFLAFRGAPTGVETLVFACSFAPLAAAVVAARTGRLVAAHGVAFLGLVALSLSLWIGLGCGAGCAIAWLITAQLEAMLAGEKRLALSAGVVTGATLIGIYAATLHGAPSPSSVTAAPEAFAGLALAYAIVIAAGSWSIVLPQRHREDDRGRTWQLVAEMFDDLVVETNAAGSVVGVPTAGETSLGMTARDLRGRGLFEHVHVADRPAFLKAIADAAHGDDTTAAMVRLRSSSLLAAVPVPPTYAWVEVRARRLADVRVVAVLRAVDATYGDEAAIAVPPPAAEDGPSRDHFLADMSHELRTPLNAIIGFSEMLASHTLRPVDASKQREYARIIYQSGQHLLSVVNAILDMSKIRSGTLAILPEPFDIVPLADLCCDMVTLKAEEGRVRLLRDYAAPQQAIVGDKRACKQILINLLSNAVKFTPVGGQVTVAVGVEGRSLVMSVSDTGIGIGAADLDRLGDPFFQARSATSRPFEGTGLGLSVVRGLVGLQGGTITIESELGRGTRVKVRLPLDGKAARPKTTSAAIQTITRRQAPDFESVEPVRSQTEQRMKSIA